MRDGRAGHLVIFLMVAAHKAEIPAMMLTGAS